MMELLGGSLRVEEAFVEGGGGRGEAEAAVFLGVLAGVFAVEGGAKAEAVMLFLEANVRRLIRLVGPTLALPTGIHPLEEVEGSPLWEEDFAAAGCC